MKFNKWTVALAAAGLVSIGHNAQAEEGYISALSKTTLSGFVDTSLSLSEGGGDTALPGRVGYQGADKMNGFNLDVVQLSLASPMDESDWAAGYAVDLLFGPDASYYSTNGTIGYDDNDEAVGDTDDVAIRQAYVNTRVPVGNGLDLKLGVFDAIIGYEGFSNRDNPNYSRNMAYNLQPFNHTGVLAGYQVSDLVSVQAGVANTGGSTVTERADNTGAVSYMGSVAIEAPDSFGALSGATLYVGLMRFGGTSGDEQENIYIGSTIPTPIEGLSLGAAYDGVSNIDGTMDADVFAAYASYQATDKMSIHGRIEYLDGDHGVLFDATDANGDVDSEMLSLTGTVQYDLWENVLTRAEVRWDSQEEGDGLYDDGSDDNLTFTLNAIYSF